MEGLKRIAAVCESVCVCGRPIVVPIAYNNSGKWFRAKAIVAAVLCVSFILEMQQT